MSKAAPDVLIKTWIDLLKSNECKEVRDKAKDNLMEHFGSIEGLVEYIKQRKV